MSRVTKNLNRVTKNLNRVMLNFSRVLKNLNRVTKKLNEVSSLDLTGDWHILRMGYLVVASKAEKNDGTYVSI